jgi:hypothetical protein
MSSRNVAIRKDVYDALRREKRPTESFTQLFLRLLSQRGPLQDLEGAWPPQPPANDARVWAAVRYGAGRRGPR